MPAAPESATFRRRALEGVGDLLVLTITPVILLAYTACISLLRLDERAHR